LEYEEGREEEVGKAGCIGEQHGGDPSRGQRYLVALGKLSRQVGERGVERKPRMYQLWIIHSDLTLFRAFLNRSICTQVSTKA